MRYLMFVFLVFISIIAFTQNEYTVLSEVILSSDGAEGTETYALIESKFGVGCIEVPDLYSVNHPGEKHITEDNDSIIGNHFVFKIHKNEDLDRDTGKTDRQRNEIKTYANSDDIVKGFNGETLRFHWYFKLQEGFSISKNFSHFFQLKAVDGDDDSQPITTISGSINSNLSEFEIIHNSGNGVSDKQLVHTNWDKANTGNWMEMEVIATFADDGYLKMTISDLEGNVLMNVENNHIDMWRTGSTFVRPKWGIYRSLKTSSYLNDGEETACFANYTIQKIDLPNQTKINNRAAKNVFNIYPNPANDRLTIEIPSNYKDLLKVVDSTGRVYMQIGVNGEDKLELSLNNLPAGAYHIIGTSSQCQVAFLKY